MLERSILSKSYLIKLHESTQGSIGNNATLWYNVIKYNKLSKLYEK